MPVNILQMDILCHFNTFLHRLTILYTALASKKDNQKSKMEGDVKRTITQGLSPGYL